MKVLIAEDEALSRRLLEAMLSGWGCDVVAVEDGAQALEVLRGPDGPRFAILDWCMPTIDGLEVCRQLRAARGEAYTYVVLLTSRQKDEDFEKGIEAGVDDYLIKPYDPIQLKLCLRTGARITRLQEEVRVQASRDGLTGLPNRTTVRARLASELARSRRDGQPVGVLMADIDHFKQVNDKRGHPAGDAVLREVARRMQGSLRPYDTVGRHGGEEFLVVLPGCDLEGARAAAEHARTDVKADPIETDGGPLRVTFSLGATSNAGHPDLGVEALVKAADDALYEAKRGGRDRVVARSPVGDAARVS